MKVAQNVELMPALATIRKDRGLTQKELGKKIGLSAMGISHLENSKREMKLNLLEKWATALRLKVQINLEVL